MTNSLRESTNVSHDPENATEKSNKCINVRTSKVSGSETSRFMSLIVKITVRCKKIRRISLSVVNMTLVTEVIKFLPRSDLVPAKSQNQSWRLKNDAPPPRREATLNTWVGLLPSEPPEGH